MKQRITLPKTALSVSRLCLGGNRFGGDLDQDASFTMLDAYVEMGGNFIDSAHVYADWIAGNERSSSEKTIGRWLKSRKPEGLVIATKGGHPGLAAGAVPRLDGANLRRDLTEALENLGMARLDLFYVHRDDPARPAAEIVAALEGFRREGLIRHYAASNWSTARLEAAEATAAEQGAEGFVANQPEWSLAVRNTASLADDAFVLDAAMAAFHQRTGMAVIPYSAQAKGYFDKAPDRLTPALARLYDNAANRRTAATLAVLAHRHGASPTEVMLAAMLRLPSPMAPIIGPRTIAQLRSSTTCLRIELNEDEIAELMVDRWVMSQWVV
jgi:aryl-alcohol dehydrogenase-like predicted oxidoreductase